MPQPLSSQTNRMGIGMPWWAVYAAAFSAPWAVEWFNDASPKLVTAMASAGQRVASPARAARPMAKATPIARGRCEAIVDVCGITARSAWPNTLWRPPAIGSSAAANSPSRTSPIPSCPGTWADRAR